MKKTVLLCLSVLLLIASLVGCQGGGAEGETEAPAPNPASDFEYTVEATGNVTITRYIGESQHVVIPATIEGKTVTEIGTNAFVTQTDRIGTPVSNVVVSLVMPDTIITIHNRAFAKCDKLENVTLSKSLKEIYGRAFKDCTGLKHITIPSSVRLIGDEAFEGSSLEYITFEDGIEEISGYGAFAQTQLKQVVFPSSLKEIGHSSFASCPNLTSVILNEGVETIAFKAFTNNPQLKEIVIPKTVKNVTEMSFNMCSGLAKVMFEGDAPETFEFADEITAWEPYNVHFTVYYHEGAQGFTSPEWYGYPTETW